jgi:hypothetical protein
MEDWTEIYFTYDDSEAGIIKGILESEGIKVIVKSMKITPYPVSIGRMGEVRIMVRQEDAGKAERILKEMEESSGNGQDDS